VIGTIVFELLDTLCFRSLMFISLRDWLSILDIECRLGVRLDLSPPFIAAGSTSLGDFLVSCCLYEPDLGC